MDLATALRKYRAAQQLGMAERVKCLSAVLRGLLDREAQSGQEPYRSTELPS